MKYLSRSEEMALVAVLRLKDNAYAVTIRNELRRTTGKAWSFGAVFVTLDRMCRKGLLRSHVSEPTRTRGGRRKRIYTLTPDATEALDAVRKLHISLWAGLPEALAEIEQ